MTEQREAWAAAFVKAQAELPDITKSKTVTIATNNGSYSYQYADLPSIVEAITDTLAAHGLAFAQSAVSNDHGEIGVTTIIVHESGHMESFGPLFLPGGGDAKAAGSAVTYARRYSLCAAFGIAADEDDDATSAVESRPAANQPSSVDDPHCPACLDQFGTLVAVTGPHDRAPFWRCTAKPDDCAGKRTHKGRQYSWSGWRETFENSAAEYHGKPVSGDVQEVMLRPDERTQRSGYMVDEIMATAGTNDKDAAIQAMKQAIVDAVQSGAVDADSILGGPVSDPPTDDELRVVAVNLTLAEADHVVASAVWMLESEMETSPNG